MKTREYHGESKTHLYKKWASMLRRVSRKWPDREFYFDKGIVVCQEWLNFSNFRNWALANGYKPTLELDRKENDKDYCPENCRFVEKIINISNRSNTIMVDYAGRIVSLTLLCKELNISEKDNRTIRRRISNGWDPKKAIETPIMVGDFRHKAPTPVIDISTNQRFESIAAAAVSLNIDRSYLSSMLKGKRRNDTTIRYAERLEFSN